MFYLIAFLSILHCNLFISICCVCNALLFFYVNKYYTIPYYTINLNLIQRIDLNE